LFSGDESTASRGTWAGLLKLKEPKSAEEVLAGCVIFSDSDQKRLGSGPGWCVGPFGAQELARVFDRYGFEIVPKGGVAKAC
jgi:hypothetical protein